MQFVSGGKTNMQKFRECLNNIESYPAPAATDALIKLDANEANMNLPPIVEDRVMARLSRIAFNRYPGEEETDLKEQIARNFSVKIENVLLGNGSSELLEKLFFCFGGKDNKIIYPVPSFSMYDTYAVISEAQGIPFPLEIDYSLDVEKLVRAIRDEKPAMAVICNPNNPTGNAIPVSDIEYVLMNTNCVVVVDEAYVEFYGMSAVSLIKKYPNLVVCRTFSKAYGLAAARVGYMIASEEICELVGKAFMPYHMNVLSLATADIVYQMRHEYVPRIQMTIAERKRLYGELKKLEHIDVFESQTNFLLVESEQAAQLVSYLAEQRISVRSFGKNSRLKNCIRISVGVREENDKLISTIKAFVEGITA